MKCNEIIFIPKQQQKNFVVKNLKTSYRNLHKFLVLALAAESLSFPFPRFVTTVT
jgi:hypothetical protein